MKCQGINIFNLNLIHIIGICIFFMFQQLTSQVNCCKTNWSLSDCSFYNKELRFPSHGKNEPELINLCPLPLYFYFRIYTVAKIWNKYFPSHWDGFMLQNIGFDLVFLDKDIFKKCTIVLQFLDFLHF